MKQVVLSLKKYVFFLLVLLNVFAVGNVSGATYYSRGSLAPNLTTSWAVNTDGSGSQPGNFTTAGDIFTVQNGHTMTMSANWAVTGNVVINDGGTLTTNATTITISGTTTIGSGASGRLNINSASGSKNFYGLVTINSGATWNNSANEAVNFRDGITNNSGTFTAGTGAYSFTNNAQALNGTFSIPTVSVTTIALTNNGNLTVGTALTGTGTLTNVATGILNLSGSGTSCSITRLTNAGTINRSGTGTTTTALANFTNTGTLNLNGSGAITGITNNAGGTVNLTNSGTITSFNNATSTSTFNISDPTVPTITTLTATVAGNTVNYNGAAQTANVTTYSNLTISGTGTKTYATIPTVNGILSLEGTASVDVTTGVVTYGANATLQYNKPAAYTATLEEWPATFSSTGGVKILNSGVITFGAAKNITNSLSLSSGSSVNLGTFTTHSAGSLTFGENPQLCGTWGSTTATSATYHNNSYFAATTGYISVGTVPAAPTTVTPGSGVAICTGSSINLNATSAGNTINWYTVLIGGTSIGNSASGVNFSVSPTGSTTYYAETQTSGGCVSVTRTATALITVYTPVPDYDAIITNATCPTSTDGAIVINKVPTAVTFANADNDNILCGSNFLSGRSAFTLEGWIKVDKSTIGSRIGLFGQNDAIELGFISNTNIECYTAGGGSLSVPLTAYPGDNNWHHIAAVGNGTNIIIYIDGVQAGIGGSATSNYGTSTDIVRIGSSVFDAVTTTTGGFTGQMLKVGFWNTALTTAYISGLASAFTAYTGSETGLIAGYNFYDGTGTSLTSLPAGNNGTFVNSPVWTEPFTYAWTKTADSYTATTKNISGLTTGEYNLTVTNGSCNRAKSFTVSSTLPVFISGAIATTGETICNGGNPAVIGSSIASSGGDNSITYEWRANGTPIASSYSATFDPASGLTTSTTYTRWAKDGTCNTTFTQSTGSWVVTVNPLLTASISSPDDPICSGDDAIFTLTGTSEATVTYSLDGGTTTDTKVLTSGTASVTITDATVNQTLTLVSVTDGTCSQSLSGTSTVTVNPLPITGSFN